MARRSRSADTSAVSFPERNGGRGAVAVAVGGAGVVLAGVGWWVLNSGDAPMPQPAGAARASPKEPDSALAAVAEVTGDGEHGRPEAVREEVAAKGGVAVSGDAGDAAAPEPLVIHVISSATGEELRHCELRVVAPGKGISVPRRNPDSADFELFLAGDSPLTLAPSTPSRGTRELLVRAAGHAPRVVVIDGAGGGKRTVALTPAAELRIEVRNAPQGERLVANLLDAVELTERARRLVGDGERHGAALPGYQARWIEQARQQLELLAGRVGPPITPVTERLLRSRNAERVMWLDREATATFRELGSGRWLVVVLRDAANDAGAERELAALGEITLTATESATLTLDWQPSRKRNVVTIAGRLELHPDWVAHGMPALPERCHVASLADPDWMIRMEMANEPVALSEGRRRDQLRFDEITLESGPAVLWVEQWRWSTRIIVPEEGDSDLVIEVPAPVEVSIGAHPMGAPEKSAAFEAQWEIATDRQVERGISMAAAQSTAQGERLTFMTPPGELLLWTGFEGRSPWTHLTRHRVTERAVALDIELRPLAQLEVTRKVDGTVMPFEFGEENHLTLRGLDRSLETCGAQMSSNRPSIQLLIDGEGRAEVRFLGDAEWLPAGPVVVELVRGATAKVELALEPVRR